MSSNVPPAGPRKRALDAELRVPDLPLDGASGGSARQEAIDAINAVWGRCFSDAEKPEDTIGHALAVHAELGIAHASALLHIGDQLARIADATAQARLADALAGPKTRAGDDR